MAHCSLNHMQPRSKWAEQAGRTAAAAAWAPLASRRRRCIPPMCRAATGSGAAAGAEQQQGKGRCYLVGAGPGPVDLLTVKAARLLERASCIVYDDLGAQEALALAPDTAERFYVGKRGGQSKSAKQQDIDQLLVQLCSEGKEVVRLKGGCLSVFSRVSHEIAALQAAGIPYELVPGISSALAAPLAAGFPLTDVQLSSSFTVVSGHDPDALDWSTFKGLPTLVLLMSGSTIPVIAERLMAQAGWQPDTPVCVVKEACGEQQQVWRSQLATVAADTAGVKLSPCIIVIGRVCEAADADRI